MNYKRTLNRYEIDALSPEEFTANTKEPILITKHRYSWAREFLTGSSHYLKDDYTKEEIATVYREAFKGGRN